MNFLLKSFVYDWFMGFCYVEAGRRIKSQKKKSLKWSDTWNGFGWYICRGLCLDLSPLLHSTPSNRVFPTVCYIYIYDTTCRAQITLQKKKISEVKPQSGYKWSVFALDLQEWKWLVCNACMHSNIRWPRDRHTELPCCVCELHAWGFDQHR